MCRLQSLIEVSDHLWGVDGPFQLGDVDLDHIHHRLHRPAGAVLVGIFNQLHQPRRSHLPEDAPAVLKPAASNLGAAVGRQGGPETVSFGLIRTGDLERDGLGEREPWRVERDVLGAGERKLDDKNCAGLAARRIDRDRVTRSIWESGRSET